LLVEGYVVAYGEVADLSVSGACLWTAGGLSAGDRLDLRLDPEDGLSRGVETAAWVVWSRRGIAGDLRTRCGLRWEEAPRPGQAALRAFIDAHCGAH
jgi:hypothetical protein